MSVPKTISMALLKLSGVITKISGKLGGSVFGTSPNGSYIKQNSYSQQPNSPAQSVQRNLIAQVTQLWRSLTPTEQASWLAEIGNYPYVNNVGDTVDYTASQLFNKLNLGRQVIGLSPNSTAPAFVASAIPVLTFNTLSAAQMSVDWVGSQVANSFVIFASQAQNFDLQPHLSTFRQIRVLTPTAINGSVSLKSDYEQVFDYPNSGQSVFVYFRPLVTSTGFGSTLTNVVGKVRV